MPTSSAATPPFRSGAESLAEARAQLMEVVRDKGYRRLDEPIQLSSGQWSRDFIDAKQALAHGSDLRAACAGFLQLFANHGVAFDAVGGLTMGADQFAHGIALLGECAWFVVRKAAKGRGTDQRVEGARVRPGTRVVVVDDVISTGHSIQQAYYALRELGAEVTFATTLVDRGTSAAGFFAREGVPYEPLLTYADFGIEPIAG